MNENTKAGLVWGALIGAGFMAVLSRIVDAVEWLLATGPADAALELAHRIALWINTPMFAPADVLGWILGLLVLVVILQVIFYGPMV